MADNRQEILQSLAALSVFSRLSGAELKKMLPVIKVIDLAAKQILKLDGEWKNYFFIVVAGRLGEVKKNRLRKKMAAKFIGPGEIIEELKLLNPRPKVITHHSLIAEEDSQLFAIPIIWFNEMAANSPNYNQVLLTVAGLAGLKLRRSNLAYTSLFLRFLHLSDHVIYILGLLSFFIFFVPWMKNIYLHTQYPLRWATLFIGLLGVMAVLVVRFEGLTWKELGIHKHGWSKHMQETIAFTLLMIVFIAVFKQVVKSFYPGFQVHHFLGMALISNLSTPRLIYGIALYILLCFIQEFLARGCLQGPLAMVLSGRHVRWKSIVIANIIYSALRVPYSLQLGLANLFVGLFWGWLYARQRNIFSVTVSHIIIGVTVVML